eukprot:1943118-Prymnesium_polylepis.1
MSQDSRHQRSRPWIQCCSKQKGLMLLALSKPTCTPFVDSRPAEHAVHRSSCRTQHSPPLPKTSLSLPPVAVSRLLEQPTNAEQLPGPGRCSTHAWAAACGPWSAF